MTTPFAQLLSIDAFKASKLMPAADVDVAAGAVWKRSSSDALATDTMSEQPFATVLAAGNATSVVFRPLANLAHDPANFATLSVYKRTGGGAPVLVAQVDTSALDWTASIPVVIPIVAAPVASGDVLTVAIAKSGTGVIVPAGTLAAITSPNAFDVSSRRWQSRILAYLRKRYDVTQIDETNPPDALLDWIARCVLPDMWRARGANPSDAQTAAAIDDRTDALKDVQVEASDASTGLIELPLANDEAGSGVSQGGPYGYTEASPYVAFDVQRATAEFEDCSGSGSGGST
ncbi:MAG TPA: hypothetical protein VGH28_10525 [Polyangiaceae bacterium]|jgi:hypothetical protein